MPSTSPSHDWENCKENAQPIKRGRDPSTFSTTTDNAQLDAQAAEFEHKIAHYSGEDPLKPWIAYIKWVQDSYPSGNNARVISLFERCTRTFKDDERYVNSDKYLKVWIGYADLLPNPTTVFKFLRVNHMFDKLSLFYIATAWAAERRGDFPLADKAYTKGIENNAQPTDILNKRHREFQRRMSRQWLNQAERERNLSAAQQDRAIYGTTTSPTSSNASRKSRQFGAITKSQAQPGARRNHRSLQRLAGGVVSPTSSNTQTKARGAFSVFVEEEARSAPDTWDATAGQQHNWKSLPDEQTIHKENNDDAIPWDERGGLGRKSKAPAPNAHGHLTKGAAPSFPVFMEDDVPEASTSRRTTGAEKPALRERQVVRAAGDGADEDSTHEATVEQLLKKPLANFDKELPTQTRKVDKHATIPTTKDTIQATTESKEDIDTDIAQVASSKAPFAVFAESRAQPDVATNKPPSSGMPFAIFSDTQADKKKAPSSSHATATSKAGFKVFGSESPSAAPLPSHSYDAKKLSTLEQTNVKQHPEQPTERRLTFSSPHPMGLQPSTTHTDSTTPAAAADRPDTRFETGSVASSLENADNEDMTINTKFALQDMMDMFGSPSLHKKKTAGDLPGGLTPISSPGSPGVVAEEQMAFQGGASSAPFTIFEESTSPQPVAQQKKKLTFAVFQDHDDEAAENDRHQPDSPIELKRRDDSQNSNHDAPMRGMLGADENVSPVASANMLKRNRSIDSIPETEVLQDNVEAAQDPENSPTNFNARTGPSTSKAFSASSLHVSEEPSNIRVLQKSSSSLSSPFTREVFSIKDDLVHQEPTSKFTDKSCLSKGLDAFEDDDLDKTFDFMTLESLLNDDDASAVVGNENDPMNVPKPAPVKTKKQPFGSSKPFAVFSG